MRIQQSTIDEIIEKADIVEVIGEYVKLEKKGNDYKGLCPFHNDSNPSLSVSPAKKIYKCFSCNEAGNAVRFIEKIKNVNYIEALKILADKYNVKMDIKENPLFEKFKKGYSIMKEATNVYEFYLKNTIEAEEEINIENEEEIDKKILYLNKKETKQRFFFLELMTRFELATCALRVRCTTSCATSACCNYSILFKLMFFRKVLLFIINYCKNFTKKF